MAKYTCPECGSPLYGTETHCAECGVPLEFESSSSSNSRRKFERSPSSASPREVERSSKTIPSSNWDYMDEGDNEAENILRNVINAIKILIIIFAIVGGIGGIIGGIIIMDDSVGLGFLIILVGVISILLGIFIARLVWAVGMIFINISTNVRTIKNNFKTEYKWPDDSYFISASAYILIAIGLLIGSAIILKLWNRFQSFLFLTAVKTRSLGGYSGECFPLPATCY